MASETGRAGRAAGGRRPGVGRLALVLLPGVPAALVPSPAAAQEIHVGFFDATVDVEGLGANSYPGFGIGGSVPVTAAFPVSVHARYNRDYGSGLYVRF